jgi:hemolysin III
MTKLRFTKGEELANAISHGFGLFLAVIATVLLICAAAQNQNAWHITSSALYGATLILLYFSSTMNHSLIHGKAKDFFHNFDQIAIYLVIAGTYTPLSLFVIRGEGGWVMFGIEWGLAIAGLLVKAFLPNKFEKGVNIFVIISYVIMGWLLLLFLPQIIANLSVASLVLVFAGGFFYTVGILFFKLERMKFSHLVWHIFVIGGSVCHWVAFYLFILNY